MNDGSLLLLHHRKQPPVSKSCYQCDRYNYPLPSNSRPLCKPTEIKMACCLPHFLFRKRKHQASTPPVNILLTNGRFPVTLDLARQLHSAGHNVFVVDPMEYHVCKSSLAVKKSYYSPAPSIDAPGYIKTVKEAVRKSEIDLIMPLYEEIFHLASCRDKEILERLFAPKFDILYRLYNK